MLSVVLAMALAGEPAALDLELACPGQYQAIESSEATVRNSADPTGTSSATVHKEVMRPGTAKVVLHGSTGEFVYPDGGRRALSRITADERQITAEYVRRLLLVPITWKVQIDRRTGDIRVASATGVGFVGTCSAAPTAAKF